MFKFDFNVEAESDNPFIEKVPATEQSQHDISKGTETIDWYGAEEVPIESKILENMDLYKLNSTDLKVGTVSISYIVSGFLLRSLHTEDNSKDICKAEQTHSDLIPGVYEGGAKIWECTLDLLHYLAEHYPKKTWRGKYVLDLGCGSGLLGLYVYKCGAKVHLQDYNKDVLEQITIPNLLLNATAAGEDGDIDLPQLQECVKCFAGDWAKYAALTTDNQEAKKFDFILTSETIYNPQNQQKLLDILHAKLATDGIVLVAAKTYYFGVGGGLRQFEALVVSDGRFRSKVLWRIAEGVGREIIELKRTSLT